MGILLQIVSMIAFTSFRSYAYIMLMRFKQLLLLGWLMAGTIF